MDLINAGLVGDNSAAITDCRVVSPIQGILHAHPSTRQIVIQIQCLALLETDADKVLIVGILNGYSTQMPRHYQRCRHRRCIGLKGASGKGDGLIGQGISGIVERDFGRESRAGKVRAFCPPQCLKGGGAGSQRVAIRVGIIGQ